MINLRNVQKIYPPDHVALRNVNLKVEDGSFLFIAGASGAGKSTLLKLLFGAERASSGQIIVGGRNLLAVASNNIAYLRRSMGIVFQDYKLLPRRTVLDNVGFTLEVQGVGREERTKVARHMLRAIGLGDKEDSFPHTLSGGEQQRVALARALVHRPRLILADEPTGNLDREMTNVVFDLLLEAHAAGVTILVATHNLAVIEELNFRTIVLDGGKIIGDFDRPRGGVT